MLHTTLYFLALLSLSTAPNWARLSLMPVDVLGFWRLSFASTLLFAWIFILKRQRLPQFTRNFFWILLSGFFFFAHLWTYKYAAKNTTIANTMIFFGTNPVWTTCGSIFFFNERFTQRLAISYSLAVIGMIILVSRQFAVHSSGLLGDVSAIASAVFFSAYILTGKKARIYFSNSIYAAFQYLTCAICFSIAVSISGNPIGSYNMTSWIAVAGLVVFPTLLGHLNFSYLMNFMNLSLMSCGKMIEPVLASIIAYFLFAEQLSIQAVIAFIFTALALVVLFVPATFVRKSNP